MAFDKNKMKTRRLKLFFASAFFCLAVAGCTTEARMSVYKELLIEARWLRNIHLPSPGEPDSYLLNFLESGTVKIYQIFDGDVREDTVRELRYIYDPDMASMAVEEYGLYEVKEINTERIVLSGTGHEVVLERYKDKDPVEEEDNKD